MHVGLFTPAWPPGTVPNGVVTYVHAMRTELQRQGHRVSLFSPEVRGSIPDVYRVSASKSDRFVAAIAARVPGRADFVFRAGRTIAAAILEVHSREPIDVIEMEESFGWAAEVARRSCIPLVCKLHGPAFLHMTAEELATSLGQKKVRREGEALRRLPVLVSPSRYTLAATLEHYALKPQIAEQVVNPIALAHGTECWTLSRCARDTILFVGRFDRVKGGDLVVLALKRLLASNPRLRLIFIGPDRGLLNADGTVTHLSDFVASLGDATLAEAISMRGQLDSATIAELRPLAAVTVVASRMESQGYTALEAMLQACPVVCTDTSGLSEIIEHGVTGLKAKPEDPDDLALQIQRLLDDLSFGRSLGRAGREYVLKHHAPAAAVGKMLEVYCRAIALKRAVASR